MLVFEPVRVHSKQHVASLCFQDLQRCQGKCCGETRTCRGCCFNQEQISGPMWFKPASLKDLYTILNAHSSDSVKMVVGNTGKGNSYYAIIYLNRIYTL